MIALSECLTYENSSGARSSGSRCHRIRRGHVQVVLVLREAEVAAALAAENQTMGRVRKRLDAEPAAEPDAGARPAVAETSEVESKKRDAKHKKLDGSLLQEGECALVRQLGKEYSPHHWAKPGRNYS